MDTTPCLSVLLSRLASSIPHRVADINRFPRWGPREYTFRFRIPFSGHLLTDLNLVILDFVLLRLRFWSIGLAKTDPKLDAKGRKLFFVTIYLARQ